MIKDARKTKSYEGGTSKHRLEFQVKPRLNKSFSNQVPYKYSKGRDSNVTKPRSQNGIGCDSPCKKPTCTKC